MIKNLCLILPNLSTAIIVVYRRYKETMICSLDDLYVDDSQNVRQIYIKNLQFNRFLQVIKDELYYNRQIDVLFYKLKTGEKIRVLNKRIQRIVISDIYRKGRRDLIFKIKLYIDLGMALMPFKWYLINVNRGQTVRQMIKLKR